MSEGLRMVLLIVFANCLFGIDPAATLIVP